MFFTAMYTVFIPWGSFLSTIGLFIYYWIAKVILNIFIYNHYFIKLNNKNLLIDI